MENKLKIFGIVLAFLIVLIAVNAQENFVSTSTIEAQISEPSIKLSFRSWGEGQVTEIRLDDYFVGERETDDRYLYISPPEIEVNINQETSIATLKARGKWLGTQDIIFTRSNLYNLERLRKELKEFESELVKKRIPPKVTKELEDINDKTIQQYLEKILDNIEKKKSKETPQIDAKFEQNELTIKVGDDIDLSVGVETDIFGTKTRKPRLEVNVRPGEEPLTEEEQLEEEGLPIVVLFPLFLIGGALLLVGGFFIFKNPEIIKRFIPKVRPTKPEIIDKDIDELLHYRKEVKDIESEINKIPLKATSNNIFALIKNFFNNITHSDYEFTYAEVTKEILEEELHKNTKGFLIKLSKEIEDFRYSNRELTKAGLLDIIKKTQRGISLSIKDVSKIQTKETIKLEEKKPVTHLWIKIRDYFKGEEGLIKTSKSNFFKNLFKDKRISKKKLDKLVKEKRKPVTFGSIFYKLGLVKTPEEKAKEARLKAREKLDEERLKLKIAEEKKKVKIAKKIAKRKAIKKFFHDLFGIYKTELEIQKEEQEKLRIKEEKERLARQILSAKKAEKQRKKDSIKRFFHTYFGLFKTRKEIELEVTKRLEEKKRKKLAKRRAIIKFFHDNFGLLKTQREIQEEKRQKEQLRLEKIRLKNKIKEEKIKAKLARRQAIKQFFHDNFGLYKTHEEKAQIIKTKLLTKRRKSEERRKAIFSFFHNTLGIKTQEEREQKRLKEGSLKLKVLKEKRKLRLERQKAFRKFFHDNFGLYKTREEKEGLALEKLRLKHKKRIERRKAFINFCHDKLGLFKTQSETRDEEERKLRLKEKIKKEKLRASNERKAAWRRFLHNRLGLFKTPKELRKLELQKSKEEQIKHKLKLKKLEERRERQRELRRFLHNHLGLFKTDSEKDKAEKIKLRKRIEGKKAFITFLHNRLGFFKTSEEIRRKNEKKARLKIQKEREKLARKKEFRNFLHDKIGLFKTQEERIREVKLKEREKLLNLENKKREEALKLKNKEREKLLKLKKKEAKKIRSLELKNKIIEKSSFLKLLFRKSVRPTDELHVLVRLEQEAIRKGEIKKAKVLQKKIDKIYHRISFYRAHPKLARDYSLVKTKILSARNRLELFEKREKGKSIFTKIKDIFSPSFEKHKIDEVEYLISKCETALKNNRKKQLQEFYLRIIHLFKKLNRVSKREVQHDILRLRENVASIAVKQALEEAHRALMEGRTKEAKKLYNKIKDNFYYLSLKQKENLVEDKAELAQKLQKSKRKFIVSVPRIPLPEFNILTLISLQKEKVVTRYQEIKQSILKSKRKEPKTQEPLKNYLLAQKPKFNSIKVDTIPKKYIDRIKKRKAKELTKHLSHLSSFVNKRNHIKAKEKYKETLEFFKEHSHDLPEEMHHLVYTTLKPVKQQILHISFKNLLSDMHKAVRGGEHELAKELKDKINSIQSHLVKDQMLPFTPPKTKFSEMRELIRETNKHLDKNHLNKAKNTYKEIDNLYQQLTPQQKRLVYGKVLDLYRKLSP